MDPRLKLARPKNNRLTPCVRCETNINVKRYKRRIVGNSWQVIDWCHVCNQIADMNAIISISAISNFNELPMCPDNFPQPSKVCVVCGSMDEVETHHWAPFKLFGEEFVLWPVSYLCKECHLMWHRKMNAPLTKKDIIKYKLG